MDTNCTCGHERAAGLRCPFCGARYEEPPSKMVEEIIKNWDDETMWADLRAAGEVK